MYKVEIAFCSKELTARERIMMKDTTNAIKLDEATKDGNKLVITPDMYAVLKVHNDKSDSEEYEQYLIRDKDGTKYVTGSPSFWSSFEDIVDEMSDENGTVEEYQIECYKLDSKNYKGKQFLTCSII